jgi:hypothetical protein
MNYQTVTINTAGGDLSATNQKLPDRFAGTDSATEWTIPAIGLTHGADGNPFPIQLHAHGIGGKLCSLYAEALQIVGETEVKGWGRLDGPAVIVQYTGYAWQAAINRELWKAINAALT